jgi:hypothetical protein
MLDALRIMLKCRKPHYLNGPNSFLELHKGRKNISVVDLEMIKRLSTMDLNEKREHIEEEKEEKEVTDLAIYDGANECLLTPFDIQEDLSSLEDNDSNQQLTLQMIVSDEEVFYSAEEY